MNLNQLVSKYQHKLNDVDYEIYNQIQTHTGSKFTIKTIADEVHVSTTTVYRFCQKIGLSGFGELKAILNMDQQQSEANLTIESLDYYYRSIVEYVDQYDTAKLFEELQQTERIYIIARSIEENRIAREMNRVFLPLEKPIIILSSDEAINKHTFVMINQLLFIFNLEPSLSLPITMTSIINRRESFVTLIGNHYQSNYHFNEQLIFPVQLSSPVTTLSYTSYMMMIEILYLKYILS